MFHAGIFIDFIRWETQVTYKSSTIKTYCANQFGKKYVFSLKTF